MAELLRVEFHCHTKYSKDSLIEIEDLLKTCRRRGIDRVVVTDHNTIEGALRAKELDPDRVIVGEEVLTQQGELLAAFVTEEVPRDLPVDEALARLKAQGAFISVSHPFDPWRGWLEEDLEKIVGELDAVEIFNARCFEAEYDWKAKAFAEKHGLLGTVGSDAHGFVELGRATMHLPEFEDADGLRLALRQAEYNCRRSSPWVRAISRYAVWRKARKGV